jgi:hypothetical protein
MTEPTTDQAPTPTPYTATELAKILGLAVGTVKGIPPAELPYYRHGPRGDRRYAREDVERYLASRRVG